MKLLILHMGLLRKPEDAFNIRGIRYANIDRLFEQVFILMPPYPENKNEIFFLENNIQVFNFHYTKLFSYLNYLKLIAEAIYLKQKYSFNLIHAYNPHMCGLVGVILKKILHLPLIISVHSNLDTVFNRGLMDYLFHCAYLTRKIESFCFHQADKIWIQATHMQDYIQKHYSIDAQKLRRIKILIDIKNYPILKEREFNAALNKKLIFVGRLDIQKNVFSLLKAYKKMRQDGYNVSLDIIGEGNQKEALLKFKEENLLNEVNFLGRIDNNRIRAHLLQADCFVHPGGMGEGFSNTLLEAQMCGLPIVVSDIYPEKEFVNKHNSVRFSYNDSDALAEKITSLIVNPEKLKYLSAMSIETARRYFEDSPIDLIKKLYQEVLYGIS